MKKEQIREALNAHWHASTVGDVNAEHDIYHDDAICDYPQSGERILGRSNLQALRSHHPGKPSGFNIRRMLGKDDLWITEYTITYQGKPAYTVSIMEFRNGKVVLSLGGEATSNFTLQRPGVYFEAGYALGRGQKVIYICKEDDIINAHFDTRNYQHILWTDKVDLRQKLIDRIDAFVKD